jgi:hypothetical protein
VCQILTTTRFARCDKKGNGMLKRPTSVSVIAWILIVISGISLITITVRLDGPAFNSPMAKELIAKNPLPISLQYALSYMQPLVNLIAGNSMLYGRNWARLLYIVFGAISLVIWFVTFPLKVAVIPGLVTFAVITFFLFRPKANEFFAPKKAANDAQGV